MPLGAAPNGQIPGYTPSFTKPYDGGKITGANFNSYMYRDQEEKLNGLSLADLNKMPIEDVPKVTNDLRRDALVNSVNCSICQASLVGKILTVPCGHKFHVDCIRQWLGKHTSCPDCRGVAGSASKKVKRRLIGWTIKSIYTRALLAAHGYDPCYERPRKYTLEHIDTFYSAEKWAIRTNTQYWRKNAPHHKRLVDDMKFLKEQHQKNKEKRWREWDEKWGTVEVNAADEYAAHAGLQVYIVTCVASAGLVDYFFGYFYKALAILVFCALVVYPMYDQLIMSDAAKAHSQKIWEEAGRESRRRIIAAENAVNARRG